MLSAEVGNITESNTEAIVNAANGIGVLGKGIAGAIRDVAGMEVQEEARQKFKDNGKPFDEGECYITSSGQLKEIGIKYIFHAVTMRLPGSPSSLNTIEKVLHNVLKKAREMKLKSITIPGLGTGIGGLNKISVALITVLVCRRYAVNMDICIKDIDEVFIKEVKKHLM